MEEYLKVLRQFQYLEAHHTYVEIYVCRYVEIYVCRYVEIYVCPYVEIYVHMYVHIVSVSWGTPYICRNLRTRRRMHLCTQDDHIGQKSWD
jgi:hypothetical protein